MFLFLDAHINNEVTSENSIVSQQEKINMCFKHFEMICEYYSNDTHCLNLSKKHFSWYLKGFKEAKQINFQAIYGKIPEEHKNLEIFK